MRAIRLSCLLCLLFLLCRCASTPANAGYETRLFAGSYDEVWAAALKALNEYPLKLSNKDSGRIQTEVINGPYNDLFFSYPDPMELPERFRYSVKMNFARLVAEGDEALTRIRIVKELERFQDFYTGWTPYPADGLEEKLLLYRIDHLLKMERTLAKESEKPPKSSP